ncbi:MAG TPA: fibro-slime domain-containing protein [Chitinispirillaceae bacterium]|nr:fibro-slime domain-containing protein [Chitinispirillaceae bacterium]
MKKKIVLRIGKKGIASVVTLLVLFGVTLLTLHTIINSRMSRTSADNYRHRIQSFYGADGMMTLLAQEMIDNNEDNYLKDALIIKNIGLFTACAHGYNPYTNVDTIRGAGKKLTGTNDRCTFLYQQFNGDVDISVKIQYMSKVIQDPFCGIMIRNQLSSISRNAAVICPYRNYNSVSMNIRRGDGNRVIDVTTKPSGYGCWIRLKRIGNTFISYRSDNGSTWKIVGKDSIPMNETVYAGLIAGSNSETDVTKGVFSDLRGMIRRSYTDSTVYALNENTYVKYTVNEIANDQFSMITEAYKMKNNGEKIYITKLDQALSRKRDSGFLSTVIDSVFLPVTYYDYRTDLSNPEFNVKASDIIVKNMIQNTLDTDRKPIPAVFKGADQPRSCLLYCFCGTGNAWYNFSIAARNDKMDHLDTTCLSFCFKNYISGPYKKGWWFSDSLKNWFRPSDAPGAEFDPYTGMWTNLKNKPKPGGGLVTDEWVGQDYDSTNSYATIVMYDSLKFREIPSGSGVFVFGDSLYAMSVDTQYFVIPCNASWVTSKYKFMPLKKKGFGYDPARYTSPGGFCSTVENYGFTMEMHRTFTYKKGQSFTFTGDDDVWVFINNRLVIDLGGIHRSTSARVSLDTLELTEGDEYWFDLFYSERSPTESNIYITTNMQLFVPPQSNKRSWKRDYGDLD